MRYPSLQAILVGGIFAAIFFTVLVLALSFPKSTWANPFEFIVENQGTASVTATTTIAYMTAGLATTTTNVFDAYENGGGAGYATNDAALEMQFTASSTNTIYGWYYEYAQGGPSANCVSAPSSCDWYADNLAPNTVGSTTPGTFSLTSINKYLYTFASSTQGGGTVSANQALPVDKIVTVQMPTRYVRAVIYLLPGSFPGGIWAAFVGRKQAAN